ncbi:hypothetical protein U0070_008968 [Myodes glareolus]|uniref:Carbohydrate sulfotransferase n=1 Tax=Myodes glareolus TaxID=447135 RepID=A0AAW0JPE0_MYOGA
MKGLNSVIKLGTWHCYPPSHLWWSERNRPLKEVALLGGYSAKQEFVSLTTMPEARKFRGEKRFPEDTKPTGKLLSDGHPDQPQVYLERLELIRNACREEALRNLSHTEVSKFVLDRIFVCDKHRILFCQTPKVGNTQWKKVLIVLNGACGMGEGESGINGGCGLV